MSDSTTFVFSSENLGTAALAIGALGTASYGIVDGIFKSFTWFDSAGFERVFAVGGKEGDGGSFRHTRPPSIHCCLH